MQRFATRFLDGGALMHNLALARHLAPKSRILAMIKADAYGHTLDVLPYLKHADAFGVACFDEAKAVRQRNSTPIVMIEGAFSAQEFAWAMTHETACVIHNHQQIVWACAYAKTHPLGGFGSRLWLKVNTGMHRLGFTTQEVLEAAHALTKAGYNLVLISHLSCADTPEHPHNAHQVATFLRILDAVKTHYPDTQGSLCNSAGLVHMPKIHLDWVRPGILLYGGRVSDAPLTTRPVMSLVGRIFAIQKVEAGQGIGYGASYIAPSARTLALVSMGYGDGYPRIQGASALIGGVLCPIAGRVAMDMIALDITDIGAQIGDAVTFWGVDEAGNVYPAHKVASFAHTIDYELFCRLTARLDTQIRTQSYDISAHKMA